MIRYGAALLLALALPASAAAPAVTPFDAARMSEHVRVLASDPFAGREPGSAGEEETVRYLVDQFKQAGLSPGGDNGGWTQGVDLWRIETDRPTLTVRNDRDSFSMTNGGAIAIGAHSPAAEVVVDGAPVVFVGYGVTAPERGWDDFKGVDLKGKVAMFLVNDPDFETPEANTFEGRAMTYYGRWTYKFEEAARRGATGALVIHEDGPAGYGFQSLANSWLQPQFDVLRDDAPARPLFESWITREAAGRMFAMAGQDFEALKRSARSRDFKPVPLAGVSLSTRFSVRRSAIRSRNVVGVLPGAQRPDETVLYTAHWDHLGTVTDASGTRIYRGAVDNASGIAGLIELARAFGRGPRPQRSIQFVAFTAEEKGLLGSEFYVAKPTRPLETTALVLNMDVLSTIGRARDLVVTSRGRVDIDPQVDRLAAALDRTATGDPTPETGTFFRSDHFWLARMGVPAIAVGVSRDLRNGGRPAGDAAYQDYVQKRYHQPADAWSPALDFSGAAEDVGLLHALGAEVANSRAWPAWREGQEFKPARDASAARRAR